MLVKNLIPAHGPPIVNSEITVFEGPVAAGKTSALLDLLWHATGDVGPDDSTTKRGAVLKDSQLVSPLNEERLMSGLIALGESETGSVFAGLDPTLSRPLEVQFRKESWSLLRRPVLSAQAVAKSDLGELLKLRFAYIPASRLAAFIATTNVANPLQAPQRLLHLLQFAPIDTMERLNAGLATIFDDIEVVIDTSQLVDLSLRVGKPPLETDSRQRAIAFSRLPKLDQQCESLQRCAAIMLVCLLCGNRVLLFDSPDAGLSPYVASRLGRWMSDNAHGPDAQMFLATNSHAFLSGLAGGNADVTLVRLQSHEGAVHCRALSPRTCRVIEDSPILRANRGAECLTASGILLTETEVERSIFQALLDAEMPGDHRLEVIQSFGPAFVVDLLGTLSSLGIPIAVHAHLDLLASSERFDAVIGQLAGDARQRGWNSIRDRLAASLEGTLDPKSLAANTREMESFLAQLKPNSSESATAITADTRHASSERWRDVRQRGLAAVPPELRPWIEEMSEELKRHGLFFSPAGQIRQWFQEGRAPTGGHWFDDALVRIQRGACPEPVLATFREIVTWLRLRAVQ